MTRDEARAFIAACRWQFASSVEAHPHWYSLRRWLTPERQADFDRFAALIERDGYPGRFWQQQWTYLDVDEHKYWISTELFGDGLIVHRALLEHPDVRPQIPGLEDER